MAPGHNVLPPSSRATGAPVARRRQLWPALSWRTSTFLFAIPLLLLLGTMTFNQAAGPEPLRLTVRDSYTGAALSGARVVIDDRAFVTDDDGAVELTMPDAPARLAVEHDRYESQASQIGGETGRQLAFNLRPTTLEGTVVDQETNAPIAGAAVSVRGDQDGSGPVATTGEDGRYALNDLPAEAVVTIDSDQYGTSEHPVEGRTQLDIAIQRSIVTGVVRGGEGEPLAGAKVSTSDGSSVVETDAEGAFRLPDAADLPEVIIRAPGYAEQRVAIPADRQIDATVEPERIKAIYASLGSIIDPERWQGLIDIADETEINAMVVDIKQDTIFYDTRVEFFRELDGVVQPAFDPTEIVATLDEHGIYSIARVVVFKDPVVAEQRPDLAVKNEESGGLWRDMNGTAWVNAFNEELWEANAALAGELAAMGFDEIQYDYIRFPSDGDLTTADFGPDYSEEARRGAIAGAVALGAERVHANGARFAIDLFPIIALQGNDQGIGQTLQDLVPLADSVNLMIYPSHYERGNIPVDGHPNDFPAETVTYTLERAEEIVPGSRLKMRPWIQDFTYPLAGYSEYGPAEVRAQIDAAEASGASGWMLWNAAGTFEVDALQPE